MLNAFNRIANVLMATGAIALGGGLTTALGTVAYGAVDSAFEEWSFEQTHKAEHIGVAGAGVALAGLVAFGFGGLSLCWAEAMQQEKNKRARPPANNEPATGAPPPPALTYQTLNGLSYHVTLSNGMNTYVQQDRHSRPQNPGVC